LLSQIERLSPKPKIALHRELQAQLIHQSLQLFRMRPDANLSA